MKQFDSINHLECLGLMPYSDGDAEIILSHLGNNVKLYFDKDLHVWTKNDDYVADLVKYK